MDGADGTGMNGGDPGRPGASRRDVLKGLAAVGAAPLVAVDSAALACDTTGPGTIPPPGSVTG